MENVAKFEPVITKAALVTQNKKIEFKGIAFVEPKRHLPDAKDKNSLNAAPYPNCWSEENEFDIKKARHEVISFATNNQRIKSNQKKMLIHQLVKLGAKLPKGPYRNYKDLVDERKRLNDIRDERKKFYKLGKNQIGYASVKCRSKTKSNNRPPVAALDQHYGTVRSETRKRK